MNNAKKRCNDKKKKSSYLKRARSGLLGLTLIWSDESPLIGGYSSISETSVTHKNPTNRLICRDMWDRCQKFIVESEFTWLVIVKVVYRSNRDGSDKIDIGEFRNTCGIRHESNKDLDSAIENFIIESRLNNSLIASSLGSDHKSHGEYLRVDFTAEIVGI